MVLNTCKAEEVQHGDITGNAANNGQKLQRIMLCTQNRIVLLGNRKYINPLSMQFKSMVRLSVKARSKHEISMVLNIKMYVDRYGRH